MNSSKDTHLSPMEIKFFEHLQSIADTGGSKSFMAEFLSVHYGLTLNEARAVRDRWLKTRKQQQQHSAFMKKQTES